MGLREFTDRAAIIHCSSAPSIASHRSQTGQAIGDPPPSPSYKGVRGGTEAREMDGWRLGRIGG